MTIELMGTVTKGALQMIDRAAFVAAFQGWPDGDVWVTFESALAFRSAAQNRYWHGAIVRPLAGHNHVPARQMHEALKIKLLPVPVGFRDRAGAITETITIGGSTATLSQHEAANLIDRGDALVVATGLELTPQPAPARAPQPAPAIVGTTCPAGRRHYWYWVGAYTLKCKHCEAVKIADR